MVVEVVNVVVGADPPLPPSFWLMTEINTGESRDAMRASPSAFGCTPSRSMAEVKPVLQSAIQMGEAVVF